MSNNLTNPNVSASGGVSQLFIEKFTGKVLEATLAAPNYVTNFTDAQSVVGTNIVTNKSIGDTKVQTLTAGVSPDADAAELDNHSLMVDTVLLARNSIAMISQIQSDISVLDKLVKNQVKKLTQVSDETFLQGVIKGAAATAGRVSGHFGGTKRTLASAGHELDSVQLLKGFQSVMLGMNEKEVENDEITCIVPYAQFYVLMDNEKLTNKDYTDSNGSVVQGFVMKAYNVRILPTNRMGATAQARTDSTWSGTHSLSKASNGNRYNVAAGDLKCVAVFFGREAILAGRTITMESDIFFEKTNKTWYADSWTAFGLIADDYKFCGALFSA